MLGSSVVVVGLVFVGDSARFENIVANYTVVTVYGYTVVAPPFVVEVQIAAAI